MSTLVNLAKALAFHYHKDQKYGEHPYSKHLEDVVLNCKMLLGNDEEAICVAYLHDIFEDTDIDRNIVLGLFGENVWQSVALLTKMRALRYDQYIERVKSYKLAHKVKYCDTLANLSQSIADGDIKRISKYTKQLDLLGDYLND